jgi:hypothetical protein
MLMLVFLFGKPWIRISFNQIPGKVPEPYEIERALIGSRSTQLTILGPRTTVTRAWKSSSPLSMEPMDSQVLDDCSKEAHCADTRRSLPRYCF